MIKEQSNKWLPNADDCLKAAEYIRCHMVDLKKRIETTKSSEAVSEHPLPIDDYLAEMRSNSRSPDVTFIPTQLAGELWTASLSMAVYVAIELARSWKQLTGRPPSKGPDTRFARFVVACWKSGLIGEHLDTNFERTLKKLKTNCKKSVSSD